MPGAHGDVEKVGEFGSWRVGVRDAQGRQIRVRAGEGAYMPFMRRAVEGH